MGEAMTLKKYKKIDSDDFQQRIHNNLLFLKEKLQGSNMLKDLDEIIS
jgi:hypothetical protein